MIGPSAEQICHPSLPDDARSPAMTAKLTIHSGLDVKAIRNHLGRGTLGPRRGSTPPWAVRRGVYPAQSQKDLFGCAEDTEGRFARRGARINGAALRPAAAPASACAPQQPPAAMQALLQALRSY